MGGGGGRVVSFVSACLRMCVHKHALVLLCILACVHTYVFVHEYKACMRSLCTICTYVRMYVQTHDTRVFGYAQAHTHTHTHTHTTINPIHPNSPYTPTDLNLLQRQILPNMVEDPQSTYVCTTHVDLSVHSGWFCGVP